MQSADRDYGRSEEIVEACMEWIGRRWTKSQIKRELREIAGLYLSVRTCNFVIRQANEKIRKLYNIDPQYYKGKQISFYESIIRREAEKTKNKLTAAERLDKLFGLEQISGDDPEVTARKIREALKEMDESIGGPDDAKEQEQRSENEGSSKTDAEQIAKQEEAKPIIENENIPPEVLEELNNIKDEDIKKFRKSLE